MGETAKLKSIGVWAVAFTLLIAVASPAALDRAVAQSATAASPVADGLATLDAVSNVSSDFPVGLEIQSTLGWSDRYDGAEIELLYTVGGDETATLVFVDPGERTDDSAVRISAVLALQAQYVPAGVAIDFWWRLVEDGVTIAQSAPERALWYDTRWQWQEQRSDQVRVHTYDHDATFARQILDSAQETVTALETRFGLAASAPLDVWVYPSLEDFRGAQQPNTRESVAGASFPGYALIVAVVPNGSTAEIGRVVLHEVSHQVLYQATANPLTYPPLWFDEGLATHFQVGGTDGYMDMVVRAYQEDALFQIASLDASFPYLPAQATLAYATSWSVVEYIERTFGDRGISNLIRAFATGAPYDQALTEALGVDSQGLDDAWRAWVAEQTD